MKIKIRSTHRPCLVTTPNKTKTLIVGGTITEVNGEEWNHPYCAIVPGDAITLDDIEWEYASATPQVDEEKEFGFWTVDSENSYNQYVVKQYRKNNVDRWTCTCPAFQYGKGKWCKHIHKVNY